MKLLILTDIHYNMQAVHAVCKLQLAVDAVVITGDLANYMHPKDPEVSIEQIKEILVPIREAYHTVYFLPGNHDPEQIYSIPTLEGCINLHDKVVQFGDLFLVGWGGSSDAYDNHKTLIWEGYPYTEDQIKMQFIPKIKEHLQKHSRNTILLTHAGPFESSTTRIKKSTDNTIYSGSNALEEIRDWNTPPLVWIHGHSHYSWGVIHELDIPVINPGAFKNDKYGIIELDQGFNIKSIELKSLN